MDPPFDPPSRSRLPALLFAPLGTGPLPPKLPDGRLPLALVPEDRLASLAAGALIVVSQMFRRWQSRSAEADWGMTGPRVTVLVLLTSARSMTMSEIAKTLEVTPRAVTRLVDGLEADGYVIRARDPDDKRVWHVTCTQKALTLADRLMPALADRMDALFEGFDVDQLRTYLDVLTTAGERIRAQLDSAEDDPTRH